MWHEINVRFCTEGRDREEAVGTLGGWLPRPDDTGNHPVDSWVFTEGRDRHEYEEERIEPWTFGWTAHVVYDRDVMKDEVRSVRYVLDLDDETASDLTEWLAAREKTSAIAEVIDSWQNYPPGTITR